jgi:hypothetical protein
MATEGSITRWIGRLKGGDGRCIGVVIGATVVILCLRIQSWTAFTWPGPIWPRRQWACRLRIASVAGLNPKVTLR